MNQGTMTTGTPADGKPRLTPKQETFCLAYLETGNASEAYRQAYRAGKMKPETINRKASELIQNGKITARLDDLRKPLLDKLHISGVKTLKRLMQGQEFDIRRLYHENGQLKHPHELDGDTAKGIAGVKYDRFGNLIEYKVIDIKGCCELIGRHLKLFTDKIEHSGDTVKCEYDPSKNIAILMASLGYDGEGKLLEEE